VCFVHVRKLMYISAAKYLALANHVITLDANCNVVREGQYMDVGKYVDVDQIEQAELPQKQQKAATTSQEEDGATKLLKAAENASADERPSSGEWAVYKWYFQAAGGLNFILFLVLCSFFVVGTTYPRMILP